ncbi:MAG: methyltransferase domain-containing protein [Candidatus Thorarchaeota archaeon]
MISNFNAKCNNNYFNYDLSNQFMKSDPAKHYDEMGDPYVRKNEKDIHNAYYNNPAIKSLISDINNKTVLEVGCGGGIQTEWLINQGANVIAFDISEKMVEYTKRRIGTRADIRVADLSQPLDFIASNSIDVIVASLVLHYIDNWLPVFEEFQRVLKEDGYIIISIHHPHADWKWFNKPNYFKKELYEDSWTIEGKPYNVTYYHRTLANIFAIFRKYDFYVDVLLEPLPTKEGKDVDSQAYEKLLTRPHFLFLRLKKIK